MHISLALVLTLLFIGCGGGGEEGIGTSSTASSIDSSPDVALASSSSSILYPEVAALYGSIIASYEYSCHDGKVFSGNDSPNQFALTQDGESISFGNLEGIALPDDFYIDTTIQTFQSTKIDENGDIYKTSMMVAGDTILGGIEYDFVATVTFSGSFHSSSLELRKSTSFTLKNSTIDEPISCSGSYIQHYNKL